MKKLLLILTLIAAGAVSAFAQQGTIRGTVYDGETGETMIGASVLIEGTTNGMAADLDGKYTIKADPGTYTLVVSFVTYETQKIENVVVKAGEVTIKDITLGVNATEMEAVVIEDKIERQAEAALLVAQKKAGIVQDGISSEQISRAGDSDAAGAIKRVTGVSVEGGKYVYVRGLGDRYSKTTLNSAEIPGLDPNRNSVQMDLFPSNLIDNLIILKTFSPDVPASFTGGYVDIITKDFPDRFTLQISTSLGFNDQATFNDNFITHDGGSLDFLGIDDGTRATPDAIDNGVPAPFINNEELDADTRSFDKNMDFTRSAPVMNHSHSISLGNQFEVAGRPFGYIASLSYSRSYSYYDNGETGLYSLTGNVSTVDELNPRYVLGVDEYRNEKGSMNTLWGAIFNSSYKLTDRSKISLNLMHNQSGEKNTLFLEGLFDEDGQVSRNNIFQTRTLQFLQRSLSSAQLKGKHAFGEETTPTEFDWITSFTISRQDEPDLRLFANDYLVLGEGDSLYRVQSAAYADPNRYYRDMREFNFDNKVNLTLPFKFRGLDSKFKTGASFVLKNRDFNERRFDYVTGNSEFGNFDGTVEDFLADDRLGIVGPSTLGVYIRDNTQPGNSYTGLENVLGLYAMVDMKFTEKLRFLGGLRYERTDIEVESDDPGKDIGTLENNDILPALNFTYALTEKMNLRLAYGRTLARPTFRELAPFPNFDFTGGYILVGNPDLQRTLIDNIDLRWEVFPNSGEIITVSGFYKNFSNPIERAFNPQAQNEISFRNVDQAVVYGAELEIRKNLGFITPALDPFSVGGNITIVESVVDIDEQEYQQIIATDPSREPQREMFGQSPYLINAFANYSGEDNGLSVNVSFNVFGARLAAVSRGGLPNVFEQPRPSLDLSVKKKFGERWTLTARGQNLLNPEYRMIHEFKGQEYVFNSYTIGRTFSLGFTYLVE